MKIGVFAPPLRGPLTGIGVASEGILGCLLELFPKDDIVLLTHRPLPPKWSTLANVHCDSRYRRLPASLWLRYRLGTIAARHSLDALWIPVPYMPRRRLGQVTTAITVYDNVWRRCPETTSRFNSLLLRAYGRDSMESADLIIVPSRATGEELVAEGLPATAVRYVPLAVSGRFSPIEQHHAFERMRELYGVTKPYVCTVGTLEPRKNLKALLEAVAIERRSGAPPFQVLVAGKVGWKNGALHAALRRSAAAPDFHFLGFVPTEHLPLLYSGATAFIFPSLYEGFGLPPLEAMACGAPVISSNAPCMPEVLGDAALYFSPREPAELAGAITRVLADGSLRSRLRAAGLRRAATFTWQRSARMLRAALAEEVSRREKRSASCGDPT